VYDGFHLAVVAGLPEGSTDILVDLLGCRMTCQALLDRVVWVRQQVHQRRKMPVGQLQELAVLMFVEQLAVVAPARYCRVQPLPQPSLTLSGLRRPPIA